MPSMADSGSKESPLDKVREAARQKRRGQYTEFWSARATADSGVKARGESKPEVSVPQQQPEGLQRQFSVVLPAGHGEAAWAWLPSSKG